MYMKSITQLPVPNSITSSTGYNRMTGNTCLCAVQVSSHWNNTTTYIHGRPTGPSERTCKDHERVQLSSSHNPDFIASYIFYALYIASRSQRAKVFFVT